MRKIAYLLHRFPRVTDTFIMREVRALERAGTDIQIISIWKPGTTETNSEIVSEWFERTLFVLPKSSLLTAIELFAAICRSPFRFLATLKLALMTGRPGVRGVIYQIFYLAEAILAVELLRQTKTTHVHNHFGDHSGIITMLASRFANIPYSISFHGPHVFFAGKYERMKEKVHHAQFVRCISYFCRSQVILFSQTTNLDLLKIVHCGLELASYQFRPPRTKVERIYCAARLAPEKGCEFLIQATRILKDKEYNLKVRLVGDGPSRKTLERMARDLEVHDRVCFLGLLGETAKKHELYNSDLCVLPSLAEGLPVSITEAMAVGVPVIATNIAGISEVVENGKTGLLVRPSDPAALADAIVAMVENYEFRRRAAELGRKKVMEEFDVDKETARLRHYLLQDCE